MDKLTHYRRSVQALLSRYAKEDVVNEGVEVQLILEYRTRSLSVDKCWLATLELGLSVHYSLRY